MASQKDVSSESGGKALCPPRISSSLAPGKKSPSYSFGWVILFNWDLDCEAPFSFYKLSLFNETDLKKEWIEKNLGVVSRVTKLKRLSPFPGEVMSLFGKIEVGKSI